MDSRRDNQFSSGNVVQILTGNSGNVDENWGPNVNDEAIWATEDDYGTWNRETSVDTNSNSNYDVRLSQSRPSNEPLNKRSRTHQTGDFMSSNKSKAIGKMFYKTKLCGKFRAGTCPYITNCNFAHSLEELRKPPPNWQDIVAAHEEERGVATDTREQFQIPIVGVSDETHRSYKGRHCKKFYTEEGCPYGENCTFLHDEQSKARESEAISLGPGSGGGGGGGGGGVGVGGVGSGYGNNEGGSTLKPSNWKTRICNKWELTGYCPFGSKCHFAHGAAELHRYGGGPLDSEVKDSSTPDAKQGVFPTKTSVDTVVVSATSVPHGDGYHMVPSQRMSNVIQNTGRRGTQKWRGPDKISKIYGDWIDDL